jgi:hypothetical protein
LAAQFDDPFEDLAEEKELLALKGPLFDTNLIRIDLEVARLLHLKKMQDKPTKKKKRPKKKKLGSGLAFEGEDDEAASGHSGTTVMTTLKKSQNGQDDYTKKWAWKLDLEEIEEAKKEEEKNPKTLEKKRT